MKGKIRYILGLISISIGSFIWYKGGHVLLGTWFWCLSSFFAQPLEYYTTLTESKFPKWDTRKFFIIASFLSAVALFFIMTTRLPEGEFEKLLGTWYFTGTVWLLGISGLTLGFLYANKKVPQEKQSVANAEDNQTENLL